MKDDGRSLEALREEAQPPPWEAARLNQFIEKASDRLEAKARGKAKRLFLTASDMLTAIARLVGIDPAHTKTGFGGFRGQGCWTPYPHALVKHNQVKTVRVYRDAGPILGPVLALVRKADGASTAMLVMDYFAARDAGDAERMREQWGKLYLEHSYYSVKPRYWALQIGLLELVQGNGVRMSYFLDLDGFRRRANQLLLNPEYTSVHDVIAQLRREFPKPFQRAGLF